VAMPGHDPRRRERRPPKPLDPVRLEELALAYVARFATSAGKLSAYLNRKLRERGWAGEAEADPAAIVSRYVELGYIDDAGFARAKAGSLRRRGYGERRVAQALVAAGIAEAEREEARGLLREQREAALTMARKRGFGPFTRAAADPDDARRLREKQLAAMLRAGHPLEMARVLVDAPSIEVAEEWAGEDEA